MIEITSAAGEETGTGDAAVDSALDTMLDTEATAQRLLALVFDVFRTFDPAAPAQDGGAADDPEVARRQLRRLLEPPDTSGEPEESTSSLHPVQSEFHPVQAETEVDALQTWVVLNQLFDQLGPGQLAAVESQTDLRALPREVVQAIDMHLDDERLSSFGKILRIGRLLLGQGFPSQ